MLLSATPPPGPRPAQETRVREEAARHRGLTPPRTHPLASITWLGPAASNPALAYRIGGDPADLAESVRWIEAASRLPHWGRAHMPDHDLDAGWLLHHLALTLRWIGNDLPDDVAALLRYKLLIQGRRLYDFAVASEGRWWSSSYWQNHNWICYAGLATAGYVLGKEAWTERAKSNLATVLDVMPEDGSHAEGVVYWRYGVPFLAIHLDLLAEAEGVDWWDRGGFMANTFDYRLHQSAPGFAFTIDHGDCHDRRSGHSAGLYYRLAAQYGIAEAQWLGDLASGELLRAEAEHSGVRPGILPEAYLEYLWYDPAVVAARPTATRAFFPDLGLLAARTGWDADATAVSFKASPGGGHRAWETSAKHRAELGHETLNQGHHHPDSGSFVLLSGAPTSPWTTATATASGRNTTICCWWTARGTRTRTATTSTRGSPSSGRPGSGTCWWATRRGGRTPRRRSPRCTTRPWGSAGWTGPWCSPRRGAWCSWTWRSRRSRGSGRSCSGRTGRRRNTATAAG